MKAISIPAFRDQFKAMKKSVGYILLVLLLKFGSLPGQPAGLTSSTKDTLNVKEGRIIVAPNKMYDKASGFKRFFFGKHYRKEWATEVEFEIIDLDTEAGGLTAFREGGGLQTKSLRLRDPNGKEYVLRSVNKDPTRALPPEFVGTFAKDVVQDQISSANPYAPMAVAELAKTVGIFHTTPRIVYVPQSDRLGTFSKNFANTLCLFEERPSGSQKNNSAFDYADEVVSTERMLRRVFIDQHQRMDERAFLKARLFDTWIGDWDRHEDQWVWAAFKENGQVVFKPIPRDRDQAFAKLDGVVPKAASRRWAVRKTKNFFSPLRDVAGLNMNGIHLDREFTTSLDREDWKAIAGDLQKQLTNERIEQAFKGWPQKVYDISGDKTIRRLKERRDALDELALKYYRFLSENVDLTGTQEKELFEISRFGDSTKIEIYSVDKEGKKNNKLFERMFYRRETEELRIYGMGGDDQFLVYGNASRGTKVRIIGGEGMDVYKEAEHASAKKIRVYEDKSNQSLIGTRFKEVHNFDTALVNFHWRSFKYDWFAPVIRPGYNPDDGFYIGGGLIFRKQHFGKSPYGWMQLFAANYAFETGAYNFWYKGVFNRALGNWNLLVDARINAPNYVFNFFGLGNDTKIIVDDRDFNRVRSDQWAASIGIGKRIGRFWNFEALPFYQSVEVEKSKERFVTQHLSGLDSTVFTKKHFTGANLKMEYNRTDNVLYPRKGMVIEGNLGFTQNIKDNDRSFLHGGLSISGYATVKALTFALRVGTAANFGDEFEFYQANTIGGSTNLRGYRRDRFSGKTSVYENTEVRLNFGTANLYILKGQLGLLAFSDVGRVWIPNEDSNTLHWGYGGGLFFVPYNKISFNITYGASTEDQLITLKAGFLF